MDHACYLLGMSDNLLDSTAEIVTETLLYLVNYHFDSSSYEHFSWITKDLEFLLNSNDSKTVSNTLYIFTKLLRYIKVVTSEFMQKVISKLEFNDFEVQKNCLLLIWEMLDRSQEELSFLIEINIFHSVIKMLKDPIYNFSKEVLKCLFNLSYAKGESLHELYKSGIISYLFAFADLENGPFKVKSLEAIYITLCAMLTMIFERNYSVKEF